MRPLVDRYFTVAWKLVKSNWRGVYYPTVPELNSHLDAVLSWLKEEGYDADGMWITEANAGTGNGPRSADFTTEYRHSMFNHGASLVCLWVANRVKYPAVAFLMLTAIPATVFRRSHMTCRNYRRLYPSHRLFHEVINIE